MHIYTLSTHIHLQTSPCFVAGTATGGADRIPSTSGRCLQGDSTGDAGDRRTFSVHHLMG